MLNQYFTIKITLRKKKSKESIKALDIHLNDPIAILFLVLLEKSINGRNVTQSNTSNSMGHNEDNVMVLNYI